MKWLIKMALREARFTRFRGLVMLFSMVFGLTVLVSFSSIKQGFHENFYNIATILTGGDLRVEIVGEPTERLKRLLPRLGDQREVYWGASIEFVNESSSLPATLWFIQLDPVALDNIEEFVDAGWPGFLDVDLALSNEQIVELNLDDNSSVDFRFVGNDQAVKGSWARYDEEVFPVWMQRVKKDSMGRIAGNTPMVDSLLRKPDVGWEQVWIYHFNGDNAKERIARAKYVLGYLNEEKQGVRLIYELPSETGFYHSFLLISNTLFMAAFSALMLGTLAYTVTFIDFSKGKTNTIALMRCLGSSMMEAWGVYGVQIAIYGLLSVLLAGSSSILIQYLVPFFISSVSGIDLEIEIYWRALFIALGFGGFFILLPGFIAILQLVNCEPIEVLRSVKMPARRVEVRWIQSILITVTVFLAIGFCLQMVDDYWFAVIYILSVGLVFGLLLLGVLGLRWVIRWLTGFRRSYPFSQAAANLFRSENQYVFTLTSISFGLFLITFLSLFFEGFARKGVHEIAGYGSISDERVGVYLDWLQHVFFINQWMGVTLLMIGVLAVFVLLTAQRRTRLYEAVVLGTLGADEDMIRNIMIYESVFAGGITATLGLIGGTIFGAIVLGVFMHLPVVIPFGMMFILLIGTVAVMVGMGFLNMKGIIGFPPLEVLRRRRHFSNW